MILWVLRVLGQGLKSECADIFHQSFLWLLRHTDEPQRGRNSCPWLQSRSVLSSFGVVLMSCRVNFSRSTISIAVFCLQNLICLHLRLVSSIIVKNLDTTGFTACVKDLQPFDQHHDPITVHYIAFGGREIKDKLIYDRISLLSSKKGALSVHCSPLLSSSLSSFYY